MTTQHGIRCLRCDDELYSSHRHDFRWCTCGAVFIDGGWDYQRIGGQPADFVRISRDVERPTQPTREVIA